MAPSKRAPRSRSRQTTPQSPPKQSASAASPRIRTRTTRSRSHEIDQSPVRQKRDEKLLPAVTEESSLDDEIQVIQPNQPESSSISAGDRSVDECRAVSDDNIDDSSSDDATQLEALDTDLIVDSLAGLYRAASQILSLLDPANDAPALIADLTSPLSKTSKRLRNFTTAFNASREAYGGGSYIDVSIILQKLTAKSGLSEGPWRPDAILQMANLSILVTSLAQNDETSIYDSLERMFNTFPEPFGELNFAADDTLFNTNLVSVTLAFGISLRTQFFLKVAERTRNEKAFDPDAILEKVFFDDDGNIKTFQPEGEGISPEFKAAIISRISTIRKHFTKKSVDSIQFAQLKKKFSWNDFLAEAFQWASLHRRQLESQLRSQGGIERVTDCLERCDFAADDRQPSSAQMSMQAAKGNAHGPYASITATPQEANSSRLLRSTGRKNTIAHLKKIQANNDDDNLSSDSSEEFVDQPSQLPFQDLTRTTPGKKPTRVEIAQSRPLPLPQEPEEVGNVDHVGDDDEEVVEQLEDELQGQESPPRPTQSSIVPTQQTLAVLEAAREQEALSRKENTNATRRLHTDKQTGAKRLQWNDSQSGQKRPRQKAEPEDDDGTHGFETDDRPQKRPRYERPTSRGSGGDLVTITGNEVIEAEDEEQDEEQDGEVLSAAVVDTPHRPNSRPQRRTPVSTQPPAQRSPTQQRSRNTIPSSSAPQPEVYCEPLQDIASRRQARRCHSTTSPANSSPQPSPCTASDYIEVNAKAKAAMRNPPFLNINRHPQVRRAWTTKETDRLLEMIESYGCAWATILAEDNKHADGPALQQRSQVQLKDKARNIKVDFLKIKRRLPTGFAAVSIKKSDKELLGMLGVPYE